jgi:hypothetical protein
MENGGGGNAFPNNFKGQVPANVIRGIGKLTWLSSKAGLIAATRPNPCTVSFQLKDFCDQGVTDLTTVLRTGFLLSFLAIPNDGNDWIASFVSPLQEMDVASECTDKEIDLEMTDQGTGNTRDPYSVEMETQSIIYMLNLFVASRSNVIPLSSLHSRISNSQNDELYRYIGSSSLKRRQFIERRSYIFGITETDGVYLQPAEIYSTVCMLAGFLLRRGGAAPSDALFSFFHNSNTIHRLMKESIAHVRGRFVDFLNRHPFVFSPFPAKFFVSVRRNIPYFDYHAFIKKHYPMYSSVNVQKQISYNNTSAVAMIMQYGNNHFGGVGMMGEDPLTPGVRPPPSASWLSNDSLTSVPNTPTAGVAPPLAAPPLRPIAPPVMHNMLSNSNSNDFLSRSDPFTNSSPPLNDFKRMTADVGIQASNEVGVGVNLGCTCKCNCGANRQQNLRDANGFIPFYNGPSNFSLFGNGTSPPPHELTPPGMTSDDKFFARSIQKEPTFSAAPGGPVSRTPSSQTPVEEPERVYDPFAYQMPLQQQLRSLKL